MRNQRRWIEKHAKGNSSLEDHEFEKAYDKAFRIDRNIRQHEGDIIYKLLGHFAEETEAYMEHFDEKFFK